MYNNVKKNENIIKNVDREWIENKQKSNPNLRKYKIRNFDNLIIPQTFSSNGCLPHLENGPSFLINNKKGVHFNQVEFTYIQADGRFCLHNNAVSDPEQLSYENIVLLASL